MRAYEAFPGIPVYVNNDEKHMYDRICKDGSLCKSDLSEYEQNCANSLVNKSIILRKKINNDLFYKKRSNRPSADTV